MDVNSLMKILRTNRNSWVDNKLKRELNERDRLHKVWCEDPRSDLKRSDYAKQRSLTEALIRSNKPGQAQVGAISKAQK